MELEANGPVGQRVYKNDDNATYGIDCKGTIWHSGSLIGRIEVNRLDGVKYAVQQNAGFYKLVVPDEDDDETIAEGLAEIHKIHKERGRVMELIEEHHETLDRM